MTTTVIKVIGMTCGHCTQSVETALTELEGVESATANLETGEVTIIQDGNVSVDTINAAVEEIGFDVAA